MMTMARIEEDNEHFVRVDREGNDTDGTEHSSKVLFDKLDCLSPS